ncbi:MAG TPA: hypothetical protein VFG23_07260 [Polyangia bacterium]|nr:hypothetical protein [Polyangia bacterium]
MRSSPLTLGCLSLLASATLGCATPAPLVRLNPKATDITWVGGRATVQATNNNIRVGTAFEYQDGPMLAMRVEIENDTTARIEVAPADFTFTDCLGEAIASCMPTLAAVDPEKVLASLDVAQSREVAESANDQALLGTLVILSAVGDVGAHHHGSGLRTAVALDAMQSDASTHDSAQASFGVRRQIWSNQALRRNTLDPGQGTSGLVFLPIDLRAGYVWFNVRLAGAVFQFPFQQVVTQIQPPAPTPVRPY